MTSKDLLDMILTCSVTDKGDGTMGSTRICKDTDVNELFGVKNAPKLEPGLWIYIRGDKFGDDAFEVLDNCTDEEIWTDEPSEYDEDIPQMYFLYRVEDM